jgi:hypothetical protein
VSRQRRGPRQQRTKLTPVQTELIAQAIAQRVQHTVKPKAPLVRGIRAKQEQMVRDIFAGISSFNKLPTN